MVAVATSADVDSAEVVKERCSRAHQEAAANDFDGVDFSDDPNSSSKRRRLGPSSLENVSVSANADIWSRVPPKEPTSVTYTDTKSSMGTQTGSNSGGGGGGSGSGSADDDSLTLVTKTHMTCAICNKKTGYGVFVRHLEKCMNIGGSRGRG
jgi:hypothetical protein